VCGCICVELISNTTFQTDMCLLPALMCACVCVRSGRYVVAGLNDALALTDGDVLSSATVKYGFEDLLLPTKLSLVDKVRGFA